MSLRYGFLKFEMNIAEKKKCSSGNQKLEYFYILVSFLEQATQLHFDIDVLDS